MHLKLFKLGIKYLLDPTMTAILDENQPIVNETMKGNASDVTLLFKEYEKNEPLLLPDNRRCSFN